MCKKDYTPQMNEYLKEVSFRVVFYSLPDFKDNFIKEFVSLRPEDYKSYAIEVLSDVKQQIVDVDAIAADLGYPIIEVASTKTYIFESVIIGEQKATVYVNPYYLFINVKTDNKCEVFSDNFAEDLNKIFNCQSLNYCAVKQFYCLTSHCCESEQQQLESIIDLKAFPQIDWERLGGAVYVDNYINGEYSVDLKRIIDKMEENKVRITIQTSTRIDSEEEVKVNYWEMYNASLKEVARCFSNGK